MQCWIRREICTEILKCIDSDLDPVMVYINKRTSLRVPEPQLMLDDFHHSIRSLLALQNTADRQYILLCQLSQ